MFRATCTFVLALAAVANAGLVYQNIEITAAISASGYGQIDPIEWWEWQHVTESDSLQISAPGDYSFVKTVSPQLATYRGTASIDFHASLNANSIAVNATMDSSGVPYSFDDASYTVRMTIGFTVDQTGEYDISMANDGVTDVTQGFRKAYLLPLTDTYAFLPGGGVTYNILYSGTTTLEAGTNYAVYMESISQPPLIYSSSGSLSLEITPVAIPEASSFVLAAGTCLSLAVAGCVKTRWKR